MPLPADFQAFLTAFNSAKFQDLHESQKWVLSKYSLDFSGQRDVAIELPTGAGKSLISLLIGEAWRRGGKKVAVLSANKTLARQMQAEAALLGVPVVLMEGKGVEIPVSDKRAYHRATSIAVMNYWVYFNQNPVLDSADLVFMDDAHLAEHCLHSLYSVEVTRHEHPSLFEAIVSELAARFPEYLVLQDALAPSDSSITPPELLSFIDQVALADRLREIVDASPLLSSDPSLKFRWRRMRTSLKEANIYVGMNSIWIRPYIYPLVSNPQYSPIAQCIYMSATIGDPADLSRQLGTRPISKIPVPPEFAETTSGRRLILMNRLNEEDIPLRLQKGILTALRKHPKSVWLCASGADATKYNGVVSAWLNANGMVGHRTWILTSLGDEIEQFKAASTGHLFVGGRFDGMNFEGDECRLVVLTTLPRAINTQEEFFCAYLRDSGFMKKRLNNRIIQAMGRCNRSPEDFAIYVLCDPKFQTHFGKQSNRIGIPGNIGAEIDMGEDVSELPEATLVERVASFLEGDFAEYDAHLAGLQNVTSASADEEANAASAQDEVTGWTALFASQNYHIAADRFEDCWESAVQKNVIELGAYYGWCWAKARYLADLQDGADVSDALELLDRSIKRGGVSAWFNRMRASLARARTSAASLPAAIQELHHAVSRAFDEVLEQTNTRGDRFQRWCNQIDAGPSIRGQCANLDNFRNQGGASGPGPTLYTAPADSTRGGIDLIRRCAMCAGQLPMRIAECGIGTACCNFPCAHGTRAA
jgi:hypothetical protein